MVFEVPEDVELCTHDQSQDTLLAIVEDLPFAGTGGGALSIGWEGGTPRRCCGGGGTGRSVKN